MLFRYKQGKIIFYEKKCATWKRREKVVQDIIKALLRGIPFPPVYASELQTGELLILDKSDKLRFLLEYLAHGDVLNDDKKQRGQNYLVKMMFIFMFQKEQRQKMVHLQELQCLQQWLAYSQTVKSIQILQ